MKRVIIAVALALGVMSCNKEDIQAGCECGVVTDDRISTTNGYVYYYTTYRRDCDGKEQEVQVNQSTYLNFHVGDEICFDNN